MSPRRRSGSNRTSTSTCAKAERRGGGADQERLRLVGERDDDLGDLGAVGLAPQIEERLAAQLAQEQGVGAGADDPQRESGRRVEFENERVGENAADRARIDVVALRRAARAAQRVPIGEQFPARGELHGGLPPSGVPKRDRTDGAPPRLQAACQGSLRVGAARVKNKLGTKLLRVGLARIVASVDEHANAQRKLQRRASQVSRSCRHGGRSSAGGDERGGSANEKGEPAAGSPFLFALVRERLGDAQAAAALGATRFSSPRAYCRGERPIVRLNAALKALSDS